MDGEEASEEEDPKERPKEREGSKARAAKIVCILHFLNLKALFKPF